MSTTAGTHVLIIVQNLPVPLDRRVWLECQALVANGYEVSVICPKGPGDPSRQLIDGVHIYKYRPAPEAKGLAGFALEFGYSWLRTAWLSLAVWRRRRFDIMQACNPPDTYWLLARLWRPRGVRFVFDQHDLNPELFRIALRRAQGCRPSAAVAWTQMARTDDIPDSEPSDRHQRVVQTNCNPARWSQAGRGDCGAERPRHASHAPGLPGWPWTERRSSFPSSTWASWDLRTMSILSWM